LLVATLLLLKAAGVPETGPLHFATRKGSTILLSPIGASFRIPKDWLEWNQQFHNNLHLSRQELEKVRDGDGEWDTEYAKVVNAALPFDECSVHAGGEGWGREGVSFGDLQMRVYLTDLSRPELKKRISGAGFTAAKIVRKDSDAHATIAEDQIDNWNRIAISYRLWYGDYGGTAEVEFYITHNAHTAVLVFMHARASGQEESIQQILKSFSWQER
jgi:hypothetical protein